MRQHRTTPMADCPNGGRQWQTGSNGKGRLPRRRTTQRWTTASAMADIIFFIQHYFLCFVDCCIDAIWVVRCWRMQNSGPLLAHAKTQACRCFGCPPVFWRLVSCVWHSPCFCSGTTAWLHCRLGVPKHLGLSVCCSTCC